MGWYLKAIVPKRCYEVGCDKKAEFELFNPMNALIGWYCQKHGQQQMQRRNFLAYEGGSREKKAD